MDVYWYDAVEYTTNMLAAEPFFCKLVGLSNFQYRGVSDAMLLAQYFN